MTAVVQIRPRSMAGPKTSLFYRLQKLLRGQVVVFLDVVDDQDGSSISRVTACHSDFSIAPSTFFPLNQVERRDPFGAAAELANMKSSVKLHKLVCQLAQIADETICNSTLSVLMRSVEPSDVNDAGMFAMSIRIRAEVGEVAHSQ